MHCDPVRLPPLLSHVSRLRISPIDRLIVANKKQPPITSTLDILGGTPAFRDTRVPVQTLVEYLEGGQTIDDFLDGFPSVTHEQVIAFFQEAKARMVTLAS